MRSGISGVLTGAALLASLMLSLSAASAETWGKDHVYADSFGNLVIDSAAGYKRILVGEGRQAKALADYTSAGQPTVVYADRDAVDTGDERCYRPPVLVKGRSYMYGFDEGVIPLQGGPCQ